MSRCRAGRLITFDMKELVRRQLLTGIERPCFGALASRLSIVIVSTPFLNAALIDSWLASSGRFRARWKLP